MSWRIMLKFSLILPSNLLDRSDFRTSKIHPFCLILQQRQSKPEVKKFDFMVDISQEPKNNKIAVKLVLIVNVQTLTINISTWQHKIAYICCTWLVCFCSIHLRSPGNLDKYWGYTGWGSEIRKCLWTVWAYTCGQKIGGESHAPGLPVYQLSIDTTFVGYISCICPG